MSEDRDSALSVNGDRVAETDGDGENVLWKPVPFHLLPYLNAAKTFAEQLERHEKSVLAFGSH